MKRINLKYLMFFTSFIFSQLIFGQYGEVSAAPTLDWSKVANDVNRNLQNNDIERQNKRIYYQNLKKESLNIIYGSTNNSDYINCKSFALKQAFYYGQQEFIYNINNVYNQLTSGNLHPNSYVAYVESYNSQFRNFANSLIFLNNKVNELVSKGKSINDIDQKINLVFNNTKFKIENNEIFIIQNNQQKINFYSLLNSLINSLNLL